MYLQFQNDDRLATMTNFYRLLIETELMDILKDMKSLKERDPEVASRVKNSAKDIIRAIEMLNLEKGAARKGLKEDTKGFENLIVYHLYRGKEYEKEIKNEQLKKCIKKIIKFKRLIQI